jgi:ribosomal protein S18 acetylase RimI-like enzyme
MAVRDIMDSRLREHLEWALGLPLDSFPPAGTRIRVSPNRTDAPRQRLCIHRLPGRDAALASGIRRVVDRLAPILEQMQPAEVFSPYGIAEIRRALGADDAGSLLAEPGLDYAITDRGAFRPATGAHEVVQLTARDIPATRKHFGLKMSDGDASPPEGVAWAFVSRERGEPASIAVIRWYEHALASISIAGTKEAYRGRGHGRAVVSAATDYILRQGRVATYGTVQSNVAAVRMIRPLGYRLAYETIYA